MGLEFDLEGVDGEQIGRLLELLAQSDVAECEIEQGEAHLFVRRRVGAALDRSDSAPLSSDEDRTQEAPTVVRSQAVGIFHRAERQSSAPAAEVGARVKVGDVLGSIEVMMVPHGVFSTHEGVLESFLVEDGQPVEFGQPLVSLQA